MCVCVWIYVCERTKEATLLDKGIFLNAGFNHAFLKALSACVFIHTKELHNRVYVCFCARMCVWKRCGEEKPERFGLSITGVKAFRTQDCFSQEPLSLSYSGYLQEDKYSGIYYRWSEKVSRSKDSRGLCQWKGSSCKDYGCLATSQLENSLLLSFSFCFHNPGTDDQFLSHTPPAPHPHTKYGQKWGILLTVW